MYISSQNNLFSRLIFGNFFQIFKGFFTFSIGILLARYFGPETFGMYAFLIMGTTFLNNFFDLGLQNTFFTFISEKKYHIKFYFYFGLLFTLQILIPVFIIFVIFPKNLFDFFFLGEEPLLVFLAYLSVVTQRQFLNTAAYINESLRNSVVANFFQFFSIFLQFFILISLTFFNLNFLVVHVFILIIISNLISTICSVSFIKRGFSETSITFKEFGNQVFPYLQGIALYASLVAILSFFDVWILSKVSGYVEQSYFQIANRFSLSFIILLAASSAIIWKETASLQKDREALLKFVNNFINSFCLIAAIFCSLLFFATGYSNDLVISFIFGEEYLTFESVTTFRLVILNTFFHTYGALIMSSFYGIKKARISYIVQTCSLGIGFLIVIVLVGNENFLSISLNLGSIGLASKILFCSVVFHSLNYLIFFKDLGFQAWINLAKLFFQISSVLLLAYLFKFSVSYIFFEGENSYLFYITYNFLFLLCLLFLVRLFPRFYGLDKINFKQIFNSG